MDAVDTTGAGDAFVAGMLSQLAANLSLIQVRNMYLFLLLNPKSLHLTTAETLAVWSTYYCLNY